MSNYLKAYNYYKSNSQAYMQEVINSMIVSEEERNILHRMATPINRVKKPVMMQSRVFSNPAKQYLDDEKTNDTYQRHLRDSEFNARMIEVEKMVNLLGTIAVGPYFNEEDKLVRYRMFLPHQYSVAASPIDPTRMTEFSYEQECVVKEHRQNKIKKTTYTWTKDTYTVTKDGSGEPEKNPYGVIPFVIFKKDNNSSLYGEFPNDLLAYADSMLVLDADLSYAILQETLVTYLFTDIIDPSDPKSGKRAKELKRARQIFAKSKIPGTGPFGTTMPGTSPITPDGKILQPTQHIEEITKSIEYKQKDFYRSWLIPQGQQEFQKTPSSYAGLKWTSEELCKWLNEQKILYQIYLRELFNKTRIVNNSHVKDSKNLKKISEKVEWSVDFANIPEIQTEQMKLATQQQQINMNLTSLIEVVKCNNRDFLDTDAKAIKYLRTVAEHNRIVKEIFETAVVEEEINRELLGVPQTTEEQVEENE